MFRCVKSQKIPISAHSNVALNRHFYSLSFKDRFFKEDFRKRPLLWAGCDSGGKADRLSNQRVDGSIYVLGQDAEPQIAPDGCFMSVRVVV